MSEDLDCAFRRLVAQFPDVPPDAVASVLGDSYQLVVGETSQPLVDKAEDLTRLRLEVRTRHPALPARDAPAGEGE